MKKIIVVGAGGHAAEIDEYILHSRKLTDSNDLIIDGFIDDDPDSYQRYKFSAPFLGTIKDHSVIKDGYYVMGIANLKYRRVFIDLFKEKGASFITFIHNSAYVSASASIGEGTIIGPNANIGPNVSIGMYNLINSRCSFGHDTIIGSYNFISPNVCFSGFSKIGDENLFGINSVTIPGLSIGNRNKIAAGMVLDQNVGDDSTVFYRFKEKILAVPKQK